MKTRHKQAKDENFPVGSLLISKELRPLVAKYYKFARMADDIADNPKLNMKQKLQALDEMEDILHQRIGNKSKKLSFINGLRKDFISENLSFSLLTDLLVAFRQDARNFTYETWAQLTEYCRWSAAPVGRFMLAIHNENPSTYLPGASLCVALQIENHLQDIKYDAKLLKRVYIPSDMLKKFGVKVKDLLKDKETPALNSLKKDILQKVKGLIKEAEVLLSIVKSRRLKLELGVILSLTHIMLKKLEKEDVLAKDVKLSKTDWLKAVVCGIAKGLFTKPKTLTTKGL